MNRLTVLNEASIKSKIYTIRGLQIMLDRDLAELYEVLTGNLNKAVKRNIERFPQDFMFQLTEDEAENLKFQLGTLNNDSLRFQNGILKKDRGKHRKYLPYVFTEQGIATLSGVLKSKKAIEVNIQVMHAFVSMRRFIASNVQVFQRLDRIEVKQIEFSNSFKQVFNALENKEPKQGIFFDGQVFDAYTFVSDLIRTAKEKIILLDNYIDDSVLTLFSQREEEVKVIIYTKEITKKLELDLKKYNSQYPFIEVKEFKKSHDRFLIIDNGVYHFGASLKDLGKKWFGFSKFDKDMFKIIERLG